MDMRCDVAVVGCGPSGAVAAALLAGHGLKAFVCDRERAVYDKPRAIALDHEILRVFQQLGLLPQVLAHAEPFTPSEYFGVDGQLIKRMTMAAEPYPLGHVPSMVFTQPPVERALRSHVATLPGATVALGTALQSFTQDSEGVTLQLRGDDGTPQTVRASYLVGCDGASSTVRAGAGIGLEDLAFDEPWLVVDVLANDRGLQRLPTTSVQYCEPGRPCTYVIGPGRHRRWEIALLPGEDPQQAATPAGTWALLARWIGPDDGTLWRQASYRFHALVAERWRDRRVFIAGDAAHQQPPFLGQGMCQGIRDVANLAWKLAAVHGATLAPAAAEALLDSYAVERGGHVRELTRRIKAIGAVISERDPTRARERDRRLLAECGGVVPDTPRQDVMPRLEAGCLSSLPGSARGTVFPQPWVAGGAGGAVLLDDVGYGRYDGDGGDGGDGGDPLAAESVGDSTGRVMGHRTAPRTGPNGRQKTGPATGWRLVCDDTLAAAAGALLAANPGVEVCWVDHGKMHAGSAAVQPAAAVLHCRELHGVVGTWMRQHRCHAALVRPDHQVFGVADTASSLRALLLEHAEMFTEDRLAARLP